MKSPVDRSEGHPSSLGPARLLGTMASIAAIALAAGCAGQDAPSPSAASAAASGMTPSVVATAPAPTSSLPNQPASADITPVPSGWTANASPASAEVIAVLEGRIDAYSGGDFATAAAYWAENGVLIEYEGSGMVFNQGREAIADRLAGVYEMGLRMEPAGTPIQFGRIVAEPVRWLPLEPGSPDASSMLVFVINDSNEIAAEYVTFWAPEP